MRALTGLFSLFVAVVAFSFAWFNSGTVTVNFLAGTWDAPLSVIMAVALLIGWFLGVASMLKPYVGLKWRTSRKATEQSKSPKIEAPTGNLQTLAK